LKGIAHEMSSGGHNFSIPLHSLLQGLWTLQLVLTGGELGRFFVNSTAGLLGFFNPAKGDPALNPPEEEDR
jgi:ABC-type transporter lipoprotein component MlaA